MTEKTYFADAFAEAFNIDTWAVEGNTTLYNHLEDYFFRFFLGLAEGRHKADDVAHFQQLF